MTGSGEDGCRRSLVAALLVAVAASGCTEPVTERTGDVGEAARPNYAVRLDTESSDASQFQVVEDDDGVRIQTGPAGIAYRSEDVVRSGDFRLEAAFQLYDAPVGYREAYGLFVGGLDLDDPDHEYTYLLIRPTGEFLIKRRLGEVTETLVDWTPHEAVVGIRTAGDEPLNTLGVDVVDGETRFRVNGAVVHAIPSARSRPYGIAGVRVNHRLDIRIDDWRLEPGARDS